MSPAISTSLLNDLACRLGTSDVFQWIEGEASRLARLGWRSPGVVRLSDKLLHARGIVKVEPTVSALPRTAFITNNEDGSYTIYYKKSVFGTRLRFAIAHEIGHTLWLRLDENSKQSRPISPYQQVFGDDPTIEHLCNRFAAALLVPREPATRIYLGLLDQRIANPLALHLIPSLARRFDVDEQLVARRIAFELFPADVILVSLRWKAGKWLTRWVAIAPSFLGQSKELIPAISSSMRRSIPKAWMPDLPPSTTVEVALPSEWNEAFRPHLRGERAKPFIRYTNKAKSPPLKGLAARLGEICYLAFNIGDL
jgi:Zn-dependent peptidase ImmA (M78 family)